MSDKVRYSREAQEAASIFSKLADTITALESVWWDRTYNSGGADELTDADVEALGITAADVNGMIVFAGALQTFLTGNRAYLSKMRNDL